MPVHNGAFVNYTFTNCQTHVVNGVVQYVNVSFSQLNASGFLCSITNAFPAFPWILLVVFYVVMLFVFSQLRDLRLLLTANSIILMLALVMVGYSLLSPAIFLAVFMAEILIAFIWYLSQPNRG